MTTPAPKLNTTAVPLDSLTKWPGNARRGDIEKIKESMLANGVYHPIDVQASNNQIIMGNHRFMALAELHEEQPQDERWGPYVDVIFHDVDDAEALRMHLSDNATADAATWDERALLAQLHEHVEKEGDLRGTGFDLDFMEDLELHHGADELDDLEGEFGTPSDDDLWPTFSVKLPPMIHQELLDALDAQGDEERPEQVRLLLARVNGK